MNDPKMPFNMVIAGVGGQGNILASALTGMAATGAGYKVVVGETYGASQRGGSVMSHVRLFKDNDYGPLVPYGKADLIVAFEPLEALRVASKYAHSETVVIVNTTPVYPVSVILNEADYPDVNSILEALKSLAREVYTVVATALAREAGDPRVQNIVMINALSKYPGQPVKRSFFDQALEDFLAGAGNEQKEMNRIAFKLPLKLERVS